MITFVDHPVRSSQFDDRIRVGSSLAGLRFEGGVRVCVSLRTYQDPEFHAWLNEKLLPRLTGKPTLFLEVAL